MIALILGFAYCIATILLVQMLFDTMFNDEILLKDLLSDENVTIEGLQYARKIMIYTAPITFIPYIIASFIYVIIRK